MTNMVNKTERGKKPKNRDEMKVMRRQKDGCGNADKQKNIHRDRIELPTAGFRCVCWGTIVREVIVLCGGAGGVATELQEGGDVHECEEPAGDVGASRGPEGQ